MLEVHYFFQIPVKNGMIILWKISLIANMPNINDEIILFDSKGYPNMLKVLEIELIKEGGITVITLETRIHENEGDEKDEIIAKYYMNELGFHLDLADENNLQNFN